LVFFTGNSRIRLPVAAKIAFASAGATGATFFFFTRLALGVPKWSGTALLVYFVTGCLCVPLWIGLSRRIGKHRTLMYSFVYAILTTPLLFFIPKGSGLLTIIAFAITGVGYGAAGFLLRAMMADVADADTAANNAERAGLMYSLLSLTSRVGLAWAVGFSFAILAWAGFDPKVADTHGTMDALRIFFIVTPVFFGIVCALIMAGYPLDEVEQRRLRGEIERRRADATQTQTAAAKGTV